MDIKDIKLICDEWKKTDCTRDCEYCDFSDFCGLMYNLTCKLNHEIVDNINPTFQEGYVQINCKNCEFHGLNCELTNLQYLQWDGRCKYQK